MNRRLISAASLSLWAVLTVGLIYLAIRKDLSWSNALTLAGLLFVVINGSLAYGSAKRQLELKGKQAPPFLVYMFFPNETRESLLVRRPFRVLFGIVFLALGALFGFAVIPLLGEAARTLSVLLAVCSLLVAALGGLFIYMGWRLVVMGDEEPLFRPLRQGDAE